jgi:pimeloyl-ACP methyl ester carboxylesterase
MLKLINKLDGLSEIMPSDNLLVIAGKIPGVWLVQIKGAGHAVSTQYPDKLDNKVLQTFLSTTTS